MLPVALAAIHLFAAGAAAQELRVRVTERGTGSTVSGALVTLRRPAGTVADEALSGPGGGASVRAPAPGTYTVRVERIGYETWESDALRLGEGRVLRRTFRVPVDPIRLEDLDVPADTRCAMPVDQGRRMTRLWGQIETALALTSAGDRSEKLTFTIRAYREFLDRSGEAVRSDTSALRIRRTLRPFDPPSPDSLARHGFMIEEDPGRYLFFAPAPSVLRSRPFFRTHCLRLRSGDEVDRPGWIGVGFEPAPGRTAPEIRGTLWIDRDNARLRRLDFRYVNLGFPDPPELAGRVRFGRLPFGRWIITSWYTRIPRVAYRTRLYDPRPGGYVVSGVDEVGARVLSVQGLDADVIYHHRRGTVYGTVTSRGGDPTRQADPEVRLEGVVRSDTAGSDGRYVLSMVPPGRYRVRVTCGALAGASVAPGAEKAVKLGAGSVVRVDLSADCSGPEAPPRETDPSGR